MTKLKEGKIVTLECINCSAPLVEIMVTRPDDPINFKFKANCPHCGDQSFIKTIQGGVHYSSTEYTTVVSFSDPAQELVTINTAKGEKPWL